MALKKPGACLALQDPQGKAGASQTKFEPQDEVGASLDFV